MTQTHHIGQEQMGMVDAARYGTARNATTLAAALSDIGSTLAILVLTQSGDGVWTLGSSLTIPANVTLWIPPGVTVNRQTGTTLTINGLVLSFNPNWQTGPGTTVRNQAAGIYLEASRVVANTGGASLPTGPSFNAPEDGVVFAGGIFPQRQIFLVTRVFEANSSQDFCVIRFFMPPQGVNNVWEMGLNGGSQWIVGRPGAPARIAIDTNGIAISNGSSSLTPSHALHMNNDDAFKSTTLWSVPSDARLKTVHADFTEGLAELRAMPRTVRFTWNGKAQTPTDAPEQIGWLAQEAAPVNPGLFTTYEDRLEPTDAEPTQLYSANYSPVLFMLVNAVKELAAQVETLAARVATLEGPTP